MKISRRSFVRLGGAAAVATIGLSGSVEGLSQTKDTLSTLSADNFRSYIGTEFHITSTGRPFPATLASVDDFIAIDGECFSMTFVATVRKASQQVYRLSHFALGDFDLLMVGHKNEGNSGILVATINRL